MSDVVLRTENLTVRFGGLLAVNDVTLDCARGRLTGLIGPNGAGKTTFIDAVTGFLPNNSSGRVALDGQDVFGRAPHVLAHDGLTRTWQKRTEHAPRTRINFRVAFRKRRANSPLTGRARHLPARGHMNRIGAVYTRVYTRVYTEAINTRHSRRLIQHRPKKFCHDCACNFTYQ